MKHAGYNSAVFDYKEVGSSTVIDITTRNKSQYKYNGQEFQDELGLNMTAMDFRQYDNALGRFHGVDALAELDYSGSTYSFGFNSPVYFSDPSGLTAEGSDTDPPKNGILLDVVFVKNNYKKKVISTNNYYNSGVDMNSLFLSSFPNGIPLISDGGGGGGGIGGLTALGLIPLKTDPIVAAMMKNYAYARNVESCPDRLNPSTIGQQFFGIGALTYPGGNNPKSYKGEYNYSYFPTNLSEFPAIGHDRRYDNLGIKGPFGLITDPRAIGADWTFVKEELTISFLTLHPKTKFQSGILGIGLGLVALPKTLLLLGNPNGYGQIRMWYDISNQGVNNIPTIHVH